MVYLPQGPPATMAQVTLAIAAHAALDTGVHGSGSDTLATDAEIDSDVGDHAAETSGVHGL